MYSRRQRSISARACSRLGNQCSEAFVAQAAIERLDVGILVRLARLDQAKLHTALLRPGHHRLAAELFAVVAANHPWQATTEREAVFVNEVVRSIMQPDGQVRLRWVTLDPG